MLDATTLEDLRACLQKEGVCVAYLFGSVARGDQGPLSDVDLAVLYGRPLSDEEAFDRTLALLAILTPLLDRQLDLIVLDVAPPELRYAIIGEGVVILNRDDDLRVEFEAYTVSEYLDTEYMRRVQRMYLYEWAREGSHADPP